eukprot:scaffold22698_cov39-Phaeocystis_antarctica.AAC.1
MTSKCAQSENNTRCYTPGGRSGDLRGGRAQAWGSGYSLGQPYCTARLTMAAHAFLGERVSQGV